MKKLIFIFYYAFTALVCFSQIIITNFSPTSGIIGSTVTITGAGFNTTTNQNVVFFGATMASVTAASSNSLTVLVPLGATYENIAVTNLASNLTAYSVHPFNVTFSGAINFTTKVDFTSGVNPFLVDIGDLDGDGKVDVITANANTHNVSVFRNTSSIGLTSLSPKLDFTSGLNPYAVNIGDIDGDGKPDIVSANGGSSSVSVFRNISTTGLINFSSKADFASGMEPRSVSIGDIDGDGKPDLAVANRNSGTISVFRNTSTAGSISFSPKVDFVTGNLPQAVSMGDIDGDGKPDLAVVNNGSDSVSVFRNISSIGVISFSLKVDFATGSSPYAISIGDLDADGKPELAVTNFFTANLSLFHNISTIGLINFSPKLNFTTATNPRSVSIGDIDGDGKPDIAVANQSSGISVFRNVSPVGVINFLPQANFVTGNTPSSVHIGDIDGDEKPDLVVANRSANLVSLLRQIPAIPSSMDASIDNFKECQQLEVFPNPAKDKLTVKWNNERSQIVINDLSGREIWRSEVFPVSVRETEINLQNIPVGFYTITLSGDSKRASTKLIITR